MTLRGVGGNPGNLAAATANVIATGRNPADVLADMGLIKLDWGLSSEDVVSKLLDFLVLKGFMPKADGAKKGDAPAGDAAKLAEALKQLQGKEGLPQTGRLDDKTSKVLVDKYKPDTSAPATPPPPGQTRAPVSAQQRDQTRFVRNAADSAMQRTLFNKAGEPVPARPSEKAVPSQSPATSSASAATTTTTTTTTTSQAKSAPAPAAPPPTTSSPATSTASQSTPAAAPPPTANASTTTSTPAKANTTSQNAAAPPPTAQGQPADPSRVTQSSSSSSSGQSGDGLGQKDSSPAGSKGTGKAEAQPGGRAGEGEGLARGDATQQLGHQDGDGNQATGDEDHKDKRRGAALVDDGSGADEGAYEIPSMEEQLRKALKDIRKEVDQDPNKPTTYLAEFVLYKPGFYQSETMAPQVLNLKVTKATAYDEVWMEALEAVNKRIKLYDKNSWPLTVDDIYNALQRARVKDDE